MADVLVIGGGIFGCATALHLVRKGAGEVVLVERDDLAYGTTAAGAGFVALWGAGHVPVWGADELAFERYAIELYAALAEREDIGFKQNGTAWVATTEQAWQARLAPIAASTAVRTEVFDGRDFAGLTGITDPEAVFRAVYQPDGSQLRAAAASRAMARLFEAEGGRIERHAPVRRVRQAHGRVVGVETENATLDAPTVVVAAGAWTNQLLGELGYWLPMVPLMASRLTTGPLGIPATMPAMIWPEFNGMWTREESGGLVWGTGYHCAPRFDVVEGEMPLRFDHVTLDGVEEMRRQGTLASAALPPLGREMSVKVAHGAPCYTPDLRALVGAVPVLEGLWTAAGCNEAGLSHGPGYGRLLADLIVDGRTDFCDAESLRPDRFGERYTSYDEVVALARDTIAQRARERA